MKEGVKIAIAEKVKEKAINCHCLHKTSLIKCEKQYIDFYKHCLNFFGCEITENTINKYLDFIVYDPLCLNKSIEQCIKEYAPKNKGFDYWMLTFAIINIAIGFVFGYLIAAP